MSNIEPTAFGDKYVLVEHIATGGMAEIYRAHYAGIEGFAKELVVKTLREEFAARPEVVSMFLDEARVAATLTHNNVVHTYDLGEIQGEYFIAMELLKGEELVNVLRRSHQAGRQIPIELGIGVIMQSCEGLHYVHTRTDDSGRSLGLVHRDINPTNIHVGYDGVCKILDFGIAATRASAVAKKGQVAGKLSYMAPEQLRGDAIDARADIFPLGVILYELCLGRRLFRGPREVITKRVLEGDIPPPTFVDPGFPPQLEAIIMKALELDPADRYQNCDHMFRDLEAYLQEEGRSWTPRKLSAIMAELFGEGAPATVRYDDEYDDLERAALDFDAFETLDAPRDEEVPPDWALGLERQGPQGSDTPARRKRALTIGNLEALVAQGRLDESGPNPIVSGGPTQSPVLRPTAADPGRSGHHRVVPVAPVDDDEDAPTEQNETVPGPAGGTAGSSWAPSGKTKTKSGRHSSAQSSGSRAKVRTGRHARTKTGSGRHGAVPKSGPERARPGTGGQRVPSTGPLAAVPDAATGRTFGHSVVSEQSKKTGATWAWILGFIAFSGLVYFAYTLFTSK